MMDSARRGGFTLVEVMIALAILSMGLVSLLVATGNNVSRSARAASESVAVDLARGKMYDLEEGLFTDGFQQLDVTKEGDFSDEGWEYYAWEGKIEKIELPDLGALQGLGAAGEGEAGAGGLPGAPGQAGQPGQSPLAGLLGMAGMGGGESDPATAGGQAVIGGQFEIIRNVLEEAIRKITLKVTWQTGGDPMELVVSYYVIDPSAVNRSIPGSGGAAAAEGEGEGDGAAGAGGEADGTASGGPRQVTPRDSRGGKGSPR